MPDSEAFDLDSFYKTNERPLTIYIYIYGFNKQVEKYIIGVMPLPFAYRS